MNLLKVATDTLNKVWIKFYVLDFTFLELHSFKTHMPLQLQLCEH